MVILRCEDAPLLGLFAPHVYQDLVGIMASNILTSNVRANQFPGSVSCAEPNR